MARAFVIRPFGRKKAGDTEIDFDAVDAKLIQPALKAAGLPGGTTGQIIEPGNIREDMFALIIEADLVIADITIHNANVFYELGIRHALRKGHSVLIKGAPVSDSTPFDILTDRYLAYNVNAPADATQSLAEMIAAALRADRETDSPVFKMLPALPDLDPASVRVVPKDLGEEVARATAARQSGWLRLLALEVGGQRFEYPALTRIGKAQSSLKDDEGALATWERIRANKADDLEANLAIANIKERDYRKKKRPELLEESNQAIARVLANPRLTTAHRAEVLALQGRNLKTLWRLEFEALEYPAARREEAVNGKLFASYDAYHQAYLQDLNHYWSGLAALQMGSIALSLAADEGWTDAFRNPVEAAERKQKIADQVEALKATVTLAVDATLGRLKQGETDTWASISRADLRFLAGDPVRPVKKAYLDAIPINDAFAWDAVKGQLQLFGKLGIRPDMVQQLVDEIGGRMRAVEPEQGLHLVVFAGHQIDGRERPTPRFPPAKEGRAKALIRQHLETFKSEGGALRVLASAAPGADIIAHELCAELGIDSTICLPMPSDVFARVAFGELDAWRSRLLRLLEARPPLQLSAQEGLPRWLHQPGVDIDPWERGNRWVVEMARSARARRVTLLALWDGQPAGDGRGGTAHMVQLAREAGNVDTVVIEYRRNCSPPPQRAPTRSSAPATLCARSRTRARRAA